MTEPQSLTALRLRKKADEVEKYSPEGALAYRDAADMVESATVNPPPLPSLGAEGDEAEDDARKVKTIWMNDTTYHLVITASAILAIRRGEVVSVSGLVDEAVREFITRHGLSAF